MANYTKKALRGSLIIFTFFMVTQFFSYLVRFLFAKKLTTIEYGLFYACFAFVSFFTIFKEFGLNEALTKFIPEFLVKKKDTSIKNSIVYAFIIQFIVTALISGAIFLLADYLSGNYFHNQLASITLKILLIGFLLDSIVVVLKNTFLGYQRYALYSSIMFFKMIAVLVSALILFSLEFKIFSPALAYAIAPFILLVIFIPVFLKKVFPKFLRIKSSWDSNLFKTLSSYGLIVMAGMAGSSLLGYADTLILTYFSLTSVALYNIALPTANIVLYMVIAISNTLFPLVSEMWAKKEDIIIKKGVELLYRTVFLAVIPVALTLFAFPDVFVRIFFGEKFLAEKVVIFGYSFVAVTFTLQILIAGIIFSVLFVINNNIINGLGKPKINTKIVFIAALINIILNFTLIPKWGIVGAAIGMSISNVLMAALSLMFLRRFLYVSLPFRAWIKTCLSGITFLIIAYSMKVLMPVDSPLLKLVIVAIAATVVYSYLLFLLRVITVAEIREWIKMSEIFH